jgi:hypothetical protein
MFITVALSGCSSLPRKLTTLDPPDISKPGSVTIRHGGGITVSKINGISPRKLDNSSFWSGDRMIYTNPGKLEILYGSNADGPLLSALSQRTIELDATSGGDYTIKSPLLFMKGTCVFVIDTKTSIIVATTRPAYFPVGTIYRK